jgi:hypothetical protein
MFYDYCPYCNQKLECEDDMDNMELACPSCGKVFVIQKTVIERPDIEEKTAHPEPELKPVEKQQPEKTLEEKNTTVENTEIITVKTPDEFFASINGEPLLTSILFWTGVIHVVAAVGCFLACLVCSAENKTFQAVSFLVSCCVLVGWSLLLFAASQFSQMIYHGICFIKNINEILENNPNINKK